MKRIVVKAPATSANLGPAFDCMGMALEMYNSVEVEEASSFSMTVSGEGGGRLPAGRGNLVYQAMERLSSEVGVSLPPLKLLCHNQVPLRRGLGSSASAVVAGLLGANRLLGDPLSPEALLPLAAEMEGHPDNVAPCLLGGCQIVISDGGRLITLPIRLAQDLRAAIFVPDMEIPTRKARSVLPRRLSLEDGVFNIGRAALLAASLATGRLEHLRQATQDRLHQPARTPLFPAMPKIIQAALDGGALGAFLSGAGSSILALALEDAEAVAEAMAQAAAACEVGGRKLILRLSPRGAYIE